MYCPPSFRQHDTAELHRQIRASGLASLVSHGADGLQASHLPLLLAAEEGEFGTAISPAPTRTGGRWRTAARRWRSSPARTPTSARPGIPAKPSTAARCRPGTTSPCTPAARSN